MSNVRKYIAYVFRAIKRMRYFPWRIQILDIITKTLAIINIYNQYLLHKMDKSMLSYLEKYYGNWIDKYKKLSIPEPTSDSSGTIWTCWFQGEENAPALVKKCIESIRRNAVNHPVVVITLENYSQYVEIPEYIMKLASERKISLTHLSDILRVKLLAIHGGMWLDSTMFYVNPIDEDLWKEPFFSPKATMSKQLHSFDSRGMVSWCICFQIAQKRHPLYLCLSDFYDLFFEQFPMEVYYFLTDYIGFIVMNRLNIKNNPKFLKGLNYVTMLCTSKREFSFFLY